MVQFFLSFPGILPCTILIPGLFFIPESPRWLVCCLVSLLLHDCTCDYEVYSWLPMQAKMGMMEDFEVSLQVLRGFDTDITLEVNEIKVAMQESIYCDCYYHY